MACTTILVGKNASYDGSTMIARNDDSGSGHFTAKKFVVIHPEEQLKVYKSVLSQDVYKRQVQGICRSGEGLLQVLQHIHELLRGLGDRKVFVMDHNKLADRKCLGEL